MAQHSVRYKEASLWGAEWIADRQRPNGALPSKTDVIESCYKGMWALHMSGRTREAWQLADHVESLLQPNGDIPVPREEQYFLDVHYLYANGYLAIGAHQLGRFGLSDRLMGFIRTMQNPIHGGFRSHGPQVEGDQRCDSVSTSIAGLAALYTGQREVAVPASLFLAKMFERQPDRDNVFYVTADVEGRLLTAGDARALKVTEPEQDWYFLGLPALFFAQLYEVTGDEAHLALARSYMDYMDKSCDPDVFVDSSAGKAGVAAAVLHRLTGQPRYLEIATQVGDLFVSRQDKAGFWTEESLDEEPSELAWSDLDMTAEYVVWLDLIARNLSGRMGSR
ncbi:MULTISPECIES: hypothetical protein [Streptomyces]|uniref:hypothetical protein n=1 Tax=Streptomyces TaxID=1883 RepID=UPI00369DAD05